MEGLLWRDYYGGAVMERLLWRGCYGWATPEFLAVRCSRAQMHPNPPSGAAALPTRCEPCHSGERVPVPGSPCAQPRAGDGEVPGSTGSHSPAGSPLSGTGTGVSRRGCGSRRCRLRPPVGRQQNTVYGSAAPAGAAGGTGRHKASLVLDLLSPGLG